MWINSLLYFFSNKECWENAYETQLSVALHKLLCVVIAGINAKCTVDVFIRAFFF